jgi:tight adherence protein C
MYPTVIALWAAAAFIVSFAALSWWTELQDPAVQRLTGLVAGTQSAEPARPRWLERFAPLSRWLMPTGGRERSRLESMLTLAGFRGPKVLSTFFGVKVLLALSLPFIWAFAAAWLPRLSSNQILLVAFAMIFVGLVAPNRWLAHRVQVRQRRLREGFPDALDLLVICVESGLGLTAAIERVAQELRFTHPELAMARFTI